MLLYLSVQFTLEFSALQYQWLEWLQICFHQTSYKVILCQGILMLRLLSVPQSRTPILWAIRIAVFDQTFESEYHFQISSQISSRLDQVLRVGQTLVHEGIYWFLLTWSFSRSVSLCSSPKSASLASVMLQMRRQSLWIICSLVTAHTGPLSTSPLYRQRLPDPDRYLESDTIGYELHNKYERFTCHVN